MATRRSDPVRPGGRRRGTADAHPDPSKEPARLKIKPPIDPPWRVQNGAFIGLVLVRVVVEGTSPTRYEDGWLPFAHDLRSIDSIKQESNKEPDQTALFHANNFVGTVNCSFGELLPHWLATRHLWDRVQEELYSGIPELAGTEFH